MGILLNQSSQVSRSALFSLQMTCSSFSDSSSFFSITKADWLPSVAEVTCGIICGCLPALPAFIRHVSGLNFKMFIPTAARSRATISSWGKSAREPVPNAASKSAITTLSSTAASGWKSPPPYLNEDSQVRTDAFSPKHHPWEEFDELQYIHGDDERLVINLKRTANQQSSV